MFDWYKAFIDSCGDNPQGCIIRIKVYGLLSIKMNRPKTNACMILYNKYVSEVDKYVVGSRYGDYGNYLRMLVQYIKAGNVITAIELLNANRRFAFVGIPPITLAYDQLLELLQSYLDGMRDTGMREMNVETSEITTVGSHNDVGGNVTGTVTGILQGALQRLSLPDHAAVAYDDPIAWKMHREKNADRASEGVGGNDQGAPTRILQGAQQQFTPSVHTIGHRQGVVNTLTNTEIRSILQNLSAFKDAMVREFPADNEVSSSFITDLTTQLYCGTLSTMLDMLQREVKLTKRGNDTLNMRNELGRKIMRYMSTALMESPYAEHSTDGNENE